MDMPVEKMLRSRQKRPAESWFRISGMAHCWYGSDIARLHGLRANAQSVTDGHWGKTAQSPPALTGSKTIPLQQQHYFHSAKTERNDTNKATSSALENVSLILNEVIPLAEPHTLVGNTSSIDCETSELTIPFQYLQNKSITSIRDILRSLVTDSDGFIHIGDDKIARSFDSFGTVLDYARLTDLQLAEIANRYSDSIRRHLFEVWSGVNYEVTDDQIWNPPLDVLPPPLSNQPASAAMCELNVKEVLKANSHCEFVRCSGHKTCRRAGCAYCVLNDRESSGNCE
ncbi:hypothetical protein AJ78_07175 [Emergomyces pasteurianus Ep9510]|uniref:Uncharacterized protein n=1 Tax=Emergomyces pasteurianus Ep9510 TaxID=1447872 RepID=A0A1J9P6W5_9EURO|nr:hypothetical protein AJ78_07175 [Emergomyces pasteurianus Ep9510]